MPAWRFLTAGKIYIVELHPFNIFDLSEIYLPLFDATGQGVILAFPVNFYQQLGKL